MRAVGCWVCGERVHGATDAELGGALAAHLRDTHGDAAPDEGAIRRWVEREGHDPTLGLAVMTAGRVLVGAAAVTFVVLALMNPGGLGGTQRTMQLMFYFALAGVAGALVCVLTLLGRLLQR
jgi:hypothetical protein